ncbi:hypothetical protein [Sediminicurvatus halobius]|uniref:hypothetical protein n=1 Tax=Sediminicurvatus halobius TaxID=2182432 RepID=UPI001304D70E|nr:hypothetical protein [Spiribacter halobius]UEX76273.1 hypothetical protein LMH63_09860 [Spiribacter halobius]
MTRKPSDLLSTAAEAANGGGNDQQRRLRALTLSRASGRAGRRARRLLQAARQRQG